MTRAKHYVGRDPETGCRNFKVASMTASRRGKTYYVRLNPARLGRDYSTWSCSCENWVHTQYREDNYKCKHIKDCEEGIQDYLLGLLKEGRLPLADEELPGTGPVASIDLVF